MEGKGKTIHSPFPSRPFVFLSKPKLKSVLNVRTLGHLGGSVVEHQPLAQVVIPGPWDHNLSQRQMLYQLSRPSVPDFLYIFD